MHTSRLADDLNACFTQYALCGGEALSQSTRDHLLSKYQAPINPTAHAPCGHYFSQRLMTTALRQSPDVANLFGGLCCGP